MFFVRYPLIFQSFLNFSGVLFVFSYSVKLFFQKTLAFFSAWDYTFLRQSNKGFAPQNQIFDSSGQGAIPYRRYSPRADAIRRKHDSVKFRGRQYSLDERRMRGKTFRLFTVLKCRFGVSGFLFSQCFSQRPEDSIFGTFFYGCRQTIVKFSTELYQVILCRSKNRNICVGRWRWPSARRRWARARCCSRQPESDGRLRHRQGRKNHR